MIQVNNIEIDKIVLENYKRPITIIYEFPYNGKYGVYVAGIDPYRQGNNNTLGEIYIYKKYKNY